MELASLPGQSPEVSLSLSQKKKIYVPGPGPADIWILATAKKKKKKKTNKALQFLPCYIKQRLCYWRLR